MPISKITKSPTGAELAYHELHKVETTPDFSQVTVYVRGYATQAGAQANEPIAWMWQLTAPASLITSLTPAFIEGLLVTDPGSPFFGGTMIPVETPLEQAKRIKRMEIKHARDRAEFGGFGWGTHRFDSDALSQQRIGMATQLAMLSMSGETAFSINWTLEDNSVIALSGSDMVAVGVTMAAHIGAAHEQSRLLRTQIEAALTVEAVAAVTWPSAA